MHNRLISNLKSGLISASFYAPDYYKEEINEIFNCVMESRSYDQCPTLTSMELLKVLDDLGHYFTLDESIDNNRLENLEMRELKKLNSLRTKIRNILTERC
jgi:hypothetical protein